MESFGKGDILLIAAFAAFEVAFTYSAVLPSIMTIGTFVDSPEKVSMIRQGEIIGTIFGLVFSGGLAYLAGSWLPLVLSLFSMAFMLGVYEWALRQAPAWGEVSA